MSERARFVALLALLLVQAVPLVALDHVRLRRDGRESLVSGKLLVTAEDGGLLLLAADGVMWAVQPAELVDHQRDDAPFAPRSAAKLEVDLVSELGQEFECHRTAHYIICHNASRPYAAWCGALLERLYAGFTNFWQRKGLALREPEFPLVAVVFRDRESYVLHARAELGPAVESIIGYYSLRSNRVTMYDLTGVESLRRPGDRRATSAQINLMLSRPEAAQSVATVVHEATHQIAYNAGVHARFADVPLWVSEGLAMFFETPDLQSPKGWQTVGRLNRTRLDRFRELMPRRPPGSLAALLTDDKRLRDARTSLDGYAESWALTYFLIRQRPQQYLHYLQTLAKKEPLLWDQPEDRLREFRQAFGPDLERLEADLLRYLERAR